jgi:acetyl-CoA carboxylase alpha subunit
MANVKRALVEELDGLIGLSTDELIEGRYDRFRALGRFSLAA